MTNRPKTSRMKSRSRSPCTISAIVELSVPISSTGPGGNSTSRSPSRTRSALRVSATIGRVSLRARTPTSTTPTNTSSSVVISEMSISRRISRSCRARVAASRAR